MRSKIQSRFENSFRKKVDYKEIDRKGKILRYIVIFPVRNRSLGVLDMFTTLASKYETYSLKLLGYGSCD